MCRILVFVCVISVKEGGGERGIELACITFGSLLTVCLSLSLSLSLQASSIRLPVESGTSRLRGFGYAEFSSLQDLMDALSLSGEVSTLSRCVHKIVENAQFWLNIVDNLFLFHPESFESAPSSGHSQW